MKFKKIYEMYKITKPLLGSRHWFPEIYFK
jgi:hypothetical protein